MGLVAFVWVLFYMGYPDRVKKLEKKVKRLEKKLKGDTIMSQLIKDLIGKKCKITKDVPVQQVVVSVILDVDDEWVKVMSTDKKNVSTTELIRIETIQNIVLVDEPGEKNIL